MYSRHEINFINYLETNQEAPSSKFLADGEARTFFDKIRGQFIYFVRVVLTLILVQFIARSVLSVVAIISNTTEITQFDELGNPVKIAVDKETWIAYETYALLRNYFHVLNF